MPLIDLNTVSDEVGFARNAYLLYKDKLHELHQKQWKDEDIHGESCVQYITYQYYLAILLVTLISKEVKEGVNTDWSYYEETYDLETKRKNLACNGIDLDDILNIFDLPINNESVEGIEGVEIEASFQIEGSGNFGIGNVENIGYLLANPNGCFNFIDDICNVPQLELDLIMEAEEGYLLSNNATFLIIS